MANLGSAKTNRYKIGTAELRVGPLTSANKLTQAHSVGIVDDVVASVKRTYAKIYAGYPKKVVDQSCISEESMVSGTLREFSRRNLGILLGKGLLADATDVSSNMTVYTAAVTATLASAASFAANDIVCAFVVGSPETATVAKIASIATNVLTFDSDICLATDFTAAIAAGSTVKVFKAAELAVGLSQVTQYFSCSIVKVDSQSGRPEVWNFWKCTCSSGLEVGSNASDYSSTKLELEVLEPSAADYATVSQGVYHLRNILPAYPVGMIVAGSDVPV